MLDLLFWMWIVIPIVSINCVVFYFNRDINPTPNPNKGSRIYYLLINMGRSLGALITKSPILGFSFIEEVVVHISATDVN